MRFIAQRLAHGLFVLWAVVTILFLMFRLMPGDPMAAYISEALPEESQNAIRAQFGLDKPLWQQYLIYLGNLARGELGTSFHQRQPVLDIILAALPNTIALTLSGPRRRLRLRRRRRRLPGLEARHRGGGHRHPARARHARRARVLARHDPARDLRLRLGWFPSGGANSAGMFGSERVERFMTSLDFLHHLACRR
jgi:peptide/nickel transport system permease protein